MARDGGVEAVSSDTAEMQRKLEARRVCVEGTAAGEEATPPEATPRRCPAAAPSPCRRAASSAAASARCAETPNGPRGRSSPPGPRGGAPPRSPLGARRSLAGQLLDAEVFDMAGGDPTTPVAGPASSEKTPRDEGEGGCEVSMRSPSQREESGPPSRLSSRHSIFEATTEEGNDSDLQGDAWTVDDWVSPSYASRQTSPCNAAWALDQRQREVADAVLSELQIDLQSQVQRAVNQMSSWISEEITFARRGFEEDVQKASEADRADRAAAHEELRGASDQLTSKVQQLQASVEQLQTAHRSRDEACKRATSEPQPSANVLEARQVADERRWRIRLDELQKGLDTLLGRVDTLDSKSCDIAERVESHGAVMEEGQAKMLGLQAQVVDGQKRRIAVEETLDRLTQKIETCSVEAGQLSDRVQMQDAAMQASTAQIHDVEAQLLAAKKKASRLHTNVEKLEADLETLGRESSGLVEKYAEHDLNIQESTDSVQTLRREVSKHFESIEGLSTDLSSVTSRASAHDADIEALVRDLMNVRAESTQHRNSLERTLRESAKLADRVSRNETGLEENKGVFQELTAQLGTSQKERLAELQVVCNKLESHEAQLNSLPSSFRAQLLSAEEGLVRAMADLSRDVKKGQAELSGQLIGKAPVSDVQSAREAMHRWVDEARRAHQAMTEELAKSLEGAAASNLEHGAALQRHEDWMRDASAWFDQVQTREQGLTEVLLRVVEEDYPDLTPFFNSL